MFSSFSSTLCAFVHLSFFTLYFIPRFPSVLAAPSYLITYDFGTRTALEDTASPVVLDAQSSTSTAAPVSHGPRTTTIALSVVFGLLFLLLVTLAVLYHMRQRAESRARAQAPTTPDFDAEKDRRTAGTLNTKDKVSVRSFPRFSILARLHGDAQSFEPCVLPPFTPSSSSTATTSTTSTPTTAAYQLTSPSAALLSLKTEKKAEVDSVSTLAPSSPVPRKDKRVPPALPLHLTREPPASENERPLPHTPSVEDHTSTRAIAPSPSAAALAGSPMSSYTLSSPAPMSPFIVPGVSRTPTASTGKSRRSSSARSKRSGVRVSGGGARERILRESRASEASAPGVSPATTEDVGGAKWLALGAGTGAKTRVWSSSGSVLGTGSAEGAMSPIAASPASSASVYTTPASSANAGSSAKFSPPVPVKTTAPRSRVPPQPLRLDPASSHHHPAPRDAALAPPPPPLASSIPIPTPAVVSAEPVPKIAPWTTAGDILDRRAIARPPPRSPGLFGSFRAGATGSRPISPGPAAPLFPPAKSLAKPAGERALDRIDAEIEEALKAVG